MLYAGSFHWRPQASVSAAAISHFTSLLATSSVLALFFLSLYWTSSTSSTKGNLPLKLFSVAVFLFSIAPTYLVIAYS